MNLADEYINISLRLENAVEILSDARMVIEKQLHTAKVSRDDSEMVRARIIDFLEVQKGGLHEACFFPLHHGYGSAIRLPR